MAAHPDPRVPAPLAGLIDAYRTIDDRVAVLIWGSALLDIPDPADVDAVVVWPGVPPDADRRRAALRASPAGSGELALSATGDRVLHDDVVFDLPHFSFAELEAELAALGRGIAPGLVSLPMPDPLAMAFGIQHALVVADPAGLGARLQALVDPFPGALRERLTAEHELLRWEIVQKARTALRRNQRMAFELLMLTGARAALVAHFAAHGHHYPGVNWPVEWATRLGVPVDPVETALRIVDHAGSPAERLAALRASLTFGAPASRPQLRTS